VDFEIPNRWVVLQVESERSGLKVSARDDRGRQRSGHSAAKITRRAGQRTATFQLPSSIVRLIEQALVDLPPRRVQPHGDDPISLPLFVGLGPRLRQEVDAATPGLPENLIQRVQTVELAPRRGTQRPPFRLPLTVLLLEPGLESSLFVHAGWYQEAYVREHGLQLETLSTAPPDAIRQAMRERFRDVVVAGGPGVLDVISVAGKLPAGAGGRRPRLVIGAGDVELRRHAVRELPAGTALLWVGKSFSEDRGFLQEFLYGWIHDHPLHDAFRVALAKRKPEPGVFLIAGPRTNQALRLSSTVAGIADEAVVLSVPNPTSLETIFQSYRGHSSKIRALDVMRARELTVGARQRIGAARGAEFEFAYERTGLAPLAMAKQHLAEARDKKRELDGIVRAAMRSPKVAAELRERQERRVDIALQSLESVPVRAVVPDQTLRRGGLYRLRVHIGHRAEESLMVGEPPSLDPLLPPTRRRKGHTLHVVVYEKDFSLLTPRVQILELPDLGGSRPVLFDLRSPERLGPARLRIKVYHRNQLLQSFLLEAAVTRLEERVSRPSPALRVSLVYSRTARFTNLGDFKTRALSVGVNQDPDGGSHLFMFKVGKAAEAIDITEEILNEQIGRFRKLLLDATRDSRGQPRFPTSLAPNATPSEEFCQAIRDLADAGGELYDTLLVRMSPELKQRLDQVARSEDQTLQVVRDDPNFVFPWPILYDFGQPEQVVGGPPAPVCLGLAAGKPCSHGPGDEVYCVRGFWGIRHALEILLARAGVIEDEVTVIERGAREGAVCVIAGTDDEPTRQFVAEMEKTLGTGIKVVGEAEDVLDLLWDEQRRPALLIVLGHLETRPIAGEPLGPRIVLVPKKRWLRAKTVTAREKSRQAWSRQPRSVVLLMACGSAATEVGTLNDFVTSLSSAGAAAVVGTECLVFSRLVTLFSQALTADLWGGKVTLGEAIKNFRRRLVRAGNPLAFVFSAAGNADLVFHLKE